MIPHCGAGAPWLSVTSTLRSDSRTNPPVPHPLYFAANGHSQSLEGRDLLAGQAVLRFEVAVVDRSGLVDLPTLAGNVAPPMRFAPHFAGSRSGEASVILDRSRSV